MAAAQRTGRSLLAGVAWWYALVEGKPSALRPRQGNALRATQALRKDPSCFGLLACEQPLLVCAAWERSAPLRYAHRWGKKHFPASSGECSRAAEPVKAKPYGLLRKP